MNKLYQLFLNFLGIYVVWLSKLGYTFSRRSSNSYFKEKNLSKLTNKAIKQYINPGMMSMLAFDLRETLFSDHTDNPLSSDETYRLTDFIADVVPNIYIIASLIMFVYFVVGGFMVITAAGNADSAQKGQQVLTNAIIGFAVIVTSYWIVQIIETITGIKIFG